VKSANFLATTIGFKVFQYQFSDHQALQNSARWFGVVNLHGRRCRSLGHGKPVVEFEMNEKGNNDSE
jgi:hypothetical protein